MSVSRNVSVPRGRLATSFARASISHCRRSLRSCPSKKPTGTIPYFSAARTSCKRACSRASGLSNDTCSKRASAFRTCEASWMGRRFRPCEATYANGRAGRRARWRALRTGMITCLRGVKSTRSERERGQQDPRVEAGPLLVLGDGQRGGVMAGAEVRDRDDRPAEAAARDARAMDALLLAHELDEQVHLRRRDLVVVPERAVRVIEELAQCGDVAFPQRGDGAEHTRVLRHDVARTARERLGQRVDPRGVGRS